MPRDSTLGARGEAVVADWLSAQGWEILRQRWRGGGGEIDLIARQELVIALVEVKTRSRGSWDQGGRLAITPKKREHLTQAAIAFLGAYPQWSDYACRFDVALVSRRPDQKLELWEYVPGAFEADCI